MFNDEISKFIITANHNKSINYSIYKNKFEKIKELHEELYNKCLEVYEKFPNENEVIWRIYNDDYDEKICKICNGKIKYLRIC